MGELPGRNSRANVSLTTTDGLPGVEVGARQLTAREQPDPHRLDEPRRDFEEVHVGVVRTPSVDPDRAVPPVAAEQRPPRKARGGHRGNRTDLLDERQRRLTGALPGRGAPWLDVHERHALGHEPGVDAGERRERREQEARQEEHRQAEGDLRATTSGRRSLARVVWRPLDP